MKTLNINSISSFIDRLKSTNFGILSAENPENMILSDLENKNRTLAFKEYLIKNKFEFSPILGKFGKVENSFLIWNINYMDVLHLSRMLNQACVLVNKGLMFSDGSYHPIDLVDINLNQNAEDNCSVITINNRPFKFSIPVNFDVKMLDIIHYSKINNLKYVDPAFMGTGQIGAEKSEMNLNSMSMLNGYLHKSCWYVSGCNKKIEAHRFGNMFVYSSKIDIYKLFALDSNVKPSDIELRKKGFIGFYSKDVGQVRVFIPMHVIKLGKSDVDGIDYHSVTGSNYLNYIQVNKRS